MFGNLECVATLNVWQSIFCHKKFTAGQTARSRLGRLKGRGDELFRWRKSFWGDFELWRCNLGQNICIPIGRYLARNHIAEENIARIANAVQCTVG